MKNSDDAYLTEAQQLAITKAQDDIIIMQRKVELVRQLPYNLNYQKVNIAPNSPLSFSLNANNLTEVLEILGKLKPRQSNSWAIEAKAFQDIRLTLHWEALIKHVGVYCTINPVKLTQSELFLINDKYPLKPAKGPKFGLYNWKFLADKTPEINT